MTVRELLHMLGRMPLDADVQFELAELPGLRFLEPGDRVVIDAVELDAQHGSGTHFERVILK